MFDDGEIAHLLNLEGLAPIWPLDKRTHLMRWMAHPTGLSYLGDWMLSLIMVWIQGQESMHRKEMMSPKSG